MAKFSNKFNEFFLQLSEKEFTEMGFDALTEFDLMKVQHGVWLLVEKGKEKKENISVQTDSENAKFQAVDEKILSLIASKPLKDRVEKRFETFLNKEEIERFKQLLKEGKIVAFKLSEKYTRAVYKLKEDIEKKQEISSSPEFEKHGFALLEESAAKTFSEKNYSKIRSGEIIGIKGFDKRYCVIARNVFDQHSEKILNYLKQNKSATIEEIAEDNKVSEDLARIVCELLKEKGDLFEKRKGIFIYID